MHTEGLGRLAALLLTWTHVKIPSNPSLCKGGGDTIGECPKAPSGWQKDTQACPQQDVSLAADSPALSPVEAHCMLTGVVLMAAFLLLNDRNWAEDSACLTAEMCPPQGFSQVCDQREGEGMAATTYCHSWDSCAGLRDTVGQATVNLDFMGLGSLFALWCSHITLGASWALKGGVTVIPTTNLMPLYMVTLAASVRIQLGTFLSYGFMSWHNMFGSPM